MLKRNIHSWLSAIKFSILPLAAASMLIAGSAQAQFVLIDDFQGLAAGTLIEGTTGPGGTWTGNAAATNSAQADPDCAANIAMQIPGEPNASSLRAEFASATTNIAAGATGTLFYRFRTPVAATGTSDHVIGLTDDNTLTNFDFKSGLRNRVIAGVNDMDLRDGGTYEQVAVFADDTWYSFWMVSNNTSPGGTFECYVQSDTDPNFATQTLLVSGGDAFNYRVDTPSDIINVYFRNANNPGGVMGNSLYIDDIYINPSAADLTNPAVAVPCGTVLKGDVDLNGVVNFLDINPFIELLSASGYSPEADCDCDGDLNFLDIQPFIDILAN